MLFPLILIISIYFLGLSLFSAFFPKHRGIIKLIGSLIFGNLIGISTLYFLSLAIVALGAKELALNLSSLSVIALSLLVLFFVLKSKGKAVFELRLDSDEKILLACASIFSAFIMFHTFGYDFSGYLEISRHVYSDFAGNIPLIRSFSLGNNIPVEYPLFAGGGIRYHFLMYFQAGLLEHLGMPIDYALNIPSIMYFTSLICLIYALGKYIFRNKYIGMLAVILFLFNGSLSFISAIEKNKTVDDILQSTEYASFAPYREGDVITAFWNLNVYVNQRHLAFGFSVVLLSLILFLQTAKKNRGNASLLLGLSLGLLPFWHGSAFLAAAMIFGGLVILHGFKKETIIVLFTSVAIAALEVIFIFHGSGTAPSIHVGYLAKDLSPQSLIFYWFLNIGLALPLMILGFYFSEKRLRILFIAFGLLFLIPNIVQFTPEVAANHKFFNLWLILANFYVAIGLIKITNIKVLPRYAMVSVLVILLTLSGLLDFIVLLNIEKGKIADDADPLVLWIKNNTSPDDVFLTSYQIYHPVGLAGRKVLLGWPYFSWSAGYDTYSRSSLIQNIYSIRAKEQMCNELQRNKIDFVVTGGNLDDYPGGKDNREFFENTFHTAFKSGTSRFIVYDVKTNCA